LISLALFIYLSSSLKNGRKIMKFLVTMILSLILAVQGAWNQGSKLVDVDQLRSGKSVTDLSNFVINDDYGKPGVPVQYFLIMAPRDGEISLSVDVKSTTTLTDVELEPSQKPIPEIYDYQPEFLKDDATYSSNQFFPQQRYQLSEKFIVRGVAFYQVKVYPYSYNPVTKEAKIEELDISWSISGTPEIDSRYYDKAIHGSLAMNSINGKAISEYRMSSSKGTKDIKGEYLIITPPQFMEAALKLSIWKSRMGMDVKIATTDETGTTESSIINYIKDGYENWAIPPKFVNLLGDVATDSEEVLIPTGYHNAHPANGQAGGYQSNHKTATDIYYAAVDGSDYKPDITIGRMLCDTPGDAMVVVDKSINYEMNPPEDSNFYNRTICAAYFQDEDHNGYADRRFAQTSEEVRDYLMDIHGKDVSRIYYTPSSVTPTNWSYDYGAYGAPIPDELLKANGFPWNGNANDISSQLNEGVQLLLHRDHGFPGGWGDPAYGCSDVNGLQNEGKLPIVYSINCSTGFFDNETAIGVSAQVSDNTYFVERWVKQSGGSVGYVGATRLSYSGQNDYFAEALISGTTGYAWPNSQQSYGNDLGTFNSPLFGDGNYQPAVAMGYAKYYYLTKNYYSSAYTRVLFEEFTYFGDPSLEMWMDQPSTITIDVTTQNSEEVVFTSSVAGLNGVLTDSYGTIYGKIETVAGENSISVDGDQFDKLFLTISGTGYTPNHQELDIVGTQLVSTDPTSITENLTPPETSTKTINVTSSLATNSNFYIKTISDSDGVETSDQYIDLTDKTGYAEFYGVQYFDGFIWASSPGEETQFDDNYLFKLDKWGNVVATYEQDTNSNNIGFADMTTDGEYIYTGMGNKVYKIDPETGGSDLLFPNAIPGIYFIKTLTYIPDMGFCTLYNGSFKFFNEEGELLSSIDGVNTGNPFSIEYDKYSNAIWVGCETGDPAATIYKYDLATRAVTETYSIDLVGGNSAQAMRGMSISTELISGKAALTIVVKDQEGSTMVNQIVKDSWIYSTNSEPINIPAGGTGSFELILDSNGYNGETKTGKAVIGDGFVETEVELTLNVAVGIDENSIDSFTLNGNYPNPFNPSTSIQFINNNLNEIKFEVYNSNGEMVEKRLISNLSNGNNIINFDGSHLNSGVYYYRLSNSDITKAGKMVLIK
jgi:hypothetical protein